MDPVWLLLIIPATVVVTLVVAASWFVHSVTKNF